MVFSGHDILLLISFYFRKECPLNSGYLMAMYYCKTGVTFIQSFCNFTIGGSSYLLAIADCSYRTVAQTGLTVAEDGSHSATERPTNGRIRRRCAGRTGQQSDPGHCCVFRIQQYQ
ncbi:hypothetical protein EYJ44_14960 [Salmonella enterica]|nr:hypothetical protein [Salmonella enterica]